MSRSTARGFTLLELIFSSALALGLLALAVSVLLPLMRSSTRITQEANLHGLGRHVIRHLSRDLGVTPAAGLSLRTTSGQVVLALQPLMGLTSDGAQIYDQSLIIYVWKASERRLRRLRWPPGPDLGVTPASTYPSRFEASTLNQMATMTVPDSRVLAGSVQGFSVSALSPQGYVVSPVAVEIVLQEAGPDGPLTYRLSTRIDLPNQASLRSSSGY